MYLILILLINVFANDLRWSNSTILICKNYTFVFRFCYYCMVLNFLLLHNLLHAIGLSCALYCTYMNLHFLQHEECSFHFWCEWAFTFVKEELFFN